jgi:hypothetical protein
MGREDRMKASDVFEKSEYVFFQKASFEDVFPQIEELSVEVEENGKGVKTGFNKLIYTKKYIGEYINCRNPLCYNGGFSIGEILREMVKNKKVDLATTRSCQGYEGSPKGRQRYKPCWNSFTIKVHIKYKEYNKGRG